MTHDDAATAITASSVVIGGVYLYRRLVEPATNPAKTPPAKGVKSLIGIGPVVPTGRFVVGWGFTFLTLSVIAQASPGLGGWFAVLAATGAILGNGQQLVTDLSTSLHPAAKNATAAGANVGAAARH